MYRQQYRPRADMDLFIQRIDLLNQVCGSDCDLLSWLSWLSLYCFTPRTTAVPLVTGCCEETCQDVLKKES